MKAPDTGALEDRYMVAADERADKAILQWQYTLRPVDKRAAQTAIAERNSIRKQIIDIRGSMPRQLDYSHG